MTCQTRQWGSCSGPCCFGFAVQVVWEPYNPVVYCTFNIGQIHWGNARGRRFFLCTHCLRSFLNSLCVAKTCCDCMHVCVCMCVFVCVHTSCARMVNKEWLTHHPTTSSSIKTVIIWHDVECMHASRMCARARTCVCIFSCVFFLLYFSSFFFGTKKIHQLCSVSQPISTIQEHADWVGWSGRACAGGDEWPWLVFYLFIFLQYCGCYRMSSVLCFF